MGEIEDRLKTIEPGKAPESPKLKSELEKVLEEEESELARELRLTMGEEVIAKHQARIKELREQLGKGGAGSEKTETEKQEAEKKLRVERIEQAKALYNSCVEAGGEPKQCAEMVAGLIPTSAASVSAPPATSITDLVHALKELDELRGSDKGLAELKQSFDNLAEAVKGNTNRQPMDPITFAKQQAEQTKEYYETLKALGMVREREPESPTYQGEPLEVVKEKHRHEEKMGELKADSDHKEKLAGIADDFSERIGHGIATDIRHGRGGQGQKPSGSNLPAFTCEECHKEFPISPEAEAKGEMTCPFCGMVYRDKSKEASEAES